MLLWMKEADVLDIYTTHKVFMCYLKMIDHEKNSSTFKSAEEERRHWITLREALGFAEAFEAKESKMNVLTDNVFNDPELLEYFAETTPKKKSHFKMPAALRRLSGRSS